MGPRDTPAAQKRAAQTAPRQHDRATTRFGGRSSGANRALSTPASWSTWSAWLSPATWSWYRVPLRRPDAGSA